MSATEPAESTVSTEQLQQLNEKMQIIKQITRNCKTEHIHKSKAFKNLLSYFTGANKQTIEQVLSVFQRKMTFSDYITSKTEIQGEPVVSYEILRSIIIDQYVNKLKLPLRSTMFTEITDLGYFPYTTTMANYDLLKHGFRWKRLPSLPDKEAGSDARVILVEETEQSSRRLMYFHKMEGYRASGRNIVHLEVVDVSRYYKDSVRMNMIAVLAASTYDGLITTKVEDDFDEWIKNNLYLVPEKSVFVIEATDLEMKQFCELPSIHSQKSKMMKWLDCYNIPYDETAHRAELYTLIELYKARCPPKYKYCEYLKAHGHEVIIRPKELSYTKYFEFLLKDLPLFVNMTVNFNEDFSDCLSKVAIEDFIAQEKNMAQKEREIYDEDKKLELLIDKIIEAFQYERLSESELKGLECETALDNNDFSDSIICKYEGP